MAIDLILRSESAGPLTQTQHDNNLTAIQNAINLVDPDAVAAKTTAYTLVAADKGKLIPATAAVTITVPSVATLGATFSCDIFAIGATVTIDGPGGTNVALAAGEIGNVFVANSQVYCAKGSATRLD